MAAFIRIALAAAALALAGCAYDRPAAPPAPQGSERPSAQNQFSDERYIWEDWEYGPNRVK